MTSRGEVIRRVWKSGPRGVKRTAWGYSVQIDSKQVRKFNAAWNKDDAQDALDRARRGPTPEPESKPAPAGVTFKQMTERYLLGRRASRKRAVTADDYFIVNLVTAFGSDTPLASITAPRIAEYRLKRLTTTSSRTGRRLAPASVNRELAVLRAILRLASDEECGYLDKAPRVKMEPTPQGRLRYLSEPEAERLLAACRQDVAHAELYPVVVIALNTGMRRGEILGLEWDRVDFSRGVLKLELTKNGERREVPMNQASYDVLTALPRIGSRLFRVSTSNLHRAFLAALRRADIRNFRFHDLRHTCASWLTMRGRPLKEVQELLGHKSITQTERYAHLAPERLREAVGVLEFQDHQHNVSKKPVAESLSQR
jgi:integrase